MCDFFYSRTRGRVVTDFLDAHDRHWNDAEILYEKERYANADHLYGFSAECGLKRLMLAFGMVVHGDVPVDSDKVHADKICKRYEAYRSGHHQGAGYGLSRSNLFSNWHASQRYHHQTQFTANTVKPHRDGADEVRQLIRKAQHEGLI